MLAETRTMTSTGTRTRLEKKMRKQELVHSQDPPTLCGLQLAPRWLLRILNRSNKKHKNDIDRFFSLQALPKNQDKKKMATAKMKVENLMGITRGRCSKGTWKQCLELTGVPIVEIVPK